MPQPAAVFDIPSAPLALDPPLPPAWVGDVIGAGSVSVSRVEQGGLTVEVTRGSRVAFYAATFTGAAGLSDTALHAAVARTYASLAELLQAEGWIPLRWWNYVPEIRRPASNGFTRYEVFNVGRFDGYRSWYGTSDFGARLSASSGVGHRGSDLVVHMLASRVCGHPAENPRQRPAFRYSARYGPRPPCFARALRIPQALHPGIPGPFAVIAGTASIVGEDSLHGGDLGAQLRETFRNLAGISEAVCGRARNGRLDEGVIRHALARYQELRAYAVHEVDCDEIAETILCEFPGLVRLELVAADLCRPELLVEIEGILPCLSAHAF